MTSQFWVQWWHFWRQLVTIVFDDVSIHHYGQIVIYHQCFWYGRWPANFGALVMHFDDWLNWSFGCRVADVGGPRDRRSPKGQGLLRKEGPPTYAILSRNLVLLWFTCFLNGHHRAFYKSHPTLGVFSTKVSLLLKGFQQKSACFQRARFQIAFVELS